MPAYKRAEERFWSRVRKGKPDECWVWTGSKRQKGYGAFPLGRDVPGNKIAQAHRFSYELAYGPVPEGRLVCHRCDVRDCVNPAHLFIGTPRQNTDDMLKKGRQAKGERKANAKLTDADIKAIRGMSATQPVIAEQFGISRSRVGVIRQHKGWGHVN